MYYLFLITVQIFNKYCLSLCGVGHDECRPVSCRFCSEQLNIEHKCASLIKTRDSILIESTKWT